MERHIILAMSRDSNLGDLRRIIEETINLSMKPYEICLNDMWDLPDNQGIFPQATSYSHSRRPVPQATRTRHQDRLQVFEFHDRKDRRKIFIQGPMGKTFTFHIDLKTALWEDLEALVEARMHLSLWELTLVLLFGGRQLDKRQLDRRRLLTDYGIQNVGHYLFVKTLSKPPILIQFNATGCCSTLIRGDGIFFSFELLGPADHTANIRA